MVSTLLHRTSVTQGFLAGIPLCNSGAFIGTFCECANYTLIVWGFIFQLHAHLLRRELSPNYLCIHFGPHTPWHKIVPFFWNKFWKLRISRIIPWKCFSFREILTQNYKKHSQGSVCVAHQQVTLVTHAQHLVVGSKSTLLLQSSMLSVKWEAHQLLWWRASAHHQRSVSNDLTIFVSLVHVKRGVLRGDSVSSCVFMSRCCVICVSWSNAKTVQRIKIWFRYQLQSISFPGHCCQSLRQKRPI